VSVTVVGSKSYTRSLDTFKELLNLYAKKGDVVLEFCDFEWGAGREVSSEFVRRNEEADLYSIYLSD